MSINLKRLKTITITYDNKIEHEVEKNTWEKTGFSTTKTPLTPVIKKQNVMGKPDGRRSMGRFRKEWKYVVRADFEKMENSDT